MAKRRDSDITIIAFLGSTVLVCIAGIVAMSIARTDQDTQPLVAIASAAVGALATKITQGGAPDEHAKQPDANNDDALATIVGRAATRSVIAEMMRQMSVPPEEPPLPPKKRAR